MKIPVTVNVQRHSSIASSTKTNQKGLTQSETIIVELQGTLESSSTDHDLHDLQASLEGADIGDLDMANPDKPILRIGNHELDGKCIKLGKPLVVLRRRERLLNSEPSPQLKESENRLSAERKTVNQFDIVDIIHRKFMFAKRPQPIISKQA